MRSVSGSTPTTLGTGETALPVSRTRRHPRVHYEDYTDFNDSFDRDNELVRLGTDVLRSNCRTIRSNSSSLMKARRSSSSSLRYSGPCIRT